MTQYTLEEENRLAFVNWFTKTNQAKEMIDWSFEVWNAALSHQAAEIERLKAEIEICKESFAQHIYKTIFNHDGYFGDWVAGGNNLKQNLSRGKVIEAIDQARKEFKQPAPSR